MQQTATTLKLNLPEVAIRVRDDSYILSVDVNSLCEELLLESNGEAEKILITQSCASYSKINENLQ